MTRARCGSAVVAVVAALLVVSAARADGEAGLVIQHGDGSIDTYCVPFSGDSISGKDLLKRVNIPVEDYGGQVCAVGNSSNEGCFAADSYDSCACKCSGSNAATCTYWAYFTAGYGKAWVYSGLGYVSQRAKDGEMQAWRWGRGGPNSAPAPPTLSFEAVCGHARRGGLAAPTVTAPPSATSAAPVAQASQSVAAGESPTSAPLTATSSPEPQPPAAGEATPERTVVVSITAHGTATATPPPARANQSKTSGGRGGLVAFGGIAAGLMALIGGALVWRRARGG